ncbi:hypothetical protein GQ457_01G009050 [Hibiscus cannabinus]
MFFETRDPRRQSYTRGGGGGATVLRLSRIALISIGDGLFIVRFSHFPGRNSPNQSTNLQQPPRDPSQLQFPSFSPIGQRGYMKE